jgi:MoaA/NifB/PqqE/SkfB family radical SAM enzyme
LDAPYYGKPFHPDIEFLKKTTDRAFGIGDYEIFEFNGGEPLLRNDLAELFEYALRYTDNADVFKTVTNGSVEIRDDLIDVWREYGDKFYCIIDNYGSKLSPRAGDNFTKLKLAGIPCEIRDMYSDSKHHGGWADFRVDEIKHTIDEAKEIYLKCGQAQKLKHCCNIINGLLMPCHMQFKLNDREICEPLPHEYIDLFDDSEPMEIKREKMRNFTDIDKIQFLTACRYCVGLYEGIERAKPAAQLTSDEIDGARCIPVSKGVLCL